MIEGSGADPYRYVVLMDPDPEGPKTSGGNPEDPDPQHCHLLVSHFMEKTFFIMFTEEKRMSARVRFSDGEEPEAQLELEPELANRLFQALLWILNHLVRLRFQHFGNSRMLCWGSRFACFWAIRIH